MTFYTVPTSFLLQDLDASPSLCFQYSSPSLNLGNLTDPGGLPLDFPLSYQSIKSSQIQGGLLVFPGGSDGKASARNAGDWFSPWVWKIPWRRKRQPTPVFLPGKSTEEPGRLPCMGLQSQTGLNDSTYFCYLLP